MGIHKIVLGHTLLFPLDGADGLGSEVHKYTVDTFYLFGDAVGDFVEDCVGNLLNSGSHSVLGVDGKDDGGPALIAALVLYADTFDIGDDNEILPYLFGKAALIKLISEDCIGLTECCQTVTGNRAKATDAKTGARERLTVNHCMGQT